MDINYYVKEILENMKLIHLEDIPNIDLYMDQVTTLMEDHLGGLKRFEDDKILTKTMINNYAKNDLLPAPIKKKYSKDHLILLTFIYYFKSFLTIGDIHTMTEPLTRNYFHAESRPTLSDIYSSLIDCFPELSAQFINDTGNIETLSEKCINNLAIPFDTSDNINEKAYLNKFYNISLLCMDVYMKKQLIESLIDSIQQTSTDKIDKKNTAKKEKEH